MKAENDKAGLKKIVEQQTNEISEQAGELLQQIKEIKDLNSQLDLLKKKGSNSSDYQQQLYDLKATLREKQDKLDTLTKSSGTLKSQITTLKKQLAELEPLKGLGEQYKCQDDTIMAQEITIDGLEADLATKQKEIDELLKQLSES